MALTDGVSFTAVSGTTADFVFGSSRPSFLTPAQAVTNATLTNGQGVSYLAQDSLTAPTQREWGHGVFTAASSSITRATINGAVNAGVSGTTAISFNVAPIVSLTALATDISTGTTLITATTPITGGAAGDLLYTDGTNLQPALLRYTTNTLNLGAADAALPVAQTVNVQNVVAGTLNTTGPDTTINASRGTGNKAGGKIIFQAAPAGVSSTNQNALAQQFAVAPTGALEGQDSNSTITMSGGFLTYKSFGSPGLSLGQTSFILGNLSAAFPSILMQGSGGGGRLGAINNGILIGGGDAANPVAQTLTVPSVTAGSSNIVGADWTIIGSKGTGTGAGGQLIFQTASGGTSGGNQNTPATGLTVTAPATSAQQPSVVVGNQALGTTATDGFLYIPGGAGPPTGTPTAFTGRYPLYWDTTDKKMFIYDSKWYGGTAPGAWTT